MLIAQSFGRLGNYFNHELVGLSTAVPWGLQILPTDIMFPKGLSADTLFHPLFLYKIIWNLIGVGIALFMVQRMRYPEPEVSIYRDGRTPTVGPGDGELAAAPENSKGPFQHDDAPGNAGKKSIAEEFGVK